jgi:SAM-dependent methyltransferase
VSLSQREQAAEFDRVAGQYRSIVEDSIRFSRRSLDFFTRVKVDHLLDLGDRLVGNLGNKSVLDVGCGNGSTDSYLCPWVGDLSGVDVSGEMVAEARRRNPDCRYDTYDGTTVPFPDAHFALSFAICVMHHLPPSHWDPFVAELLRVTRTDGTVMVFEHNPLNPLTRRAVRSCAFDDDAVLLGPKRVTAAFRRAGADVVARRYVLFTPLDSATARDAERLVSWLPLGAQYVVAARPIAE